MGADHAWVSSHHAWLGADRWSALLLAPASTHGVDLLPTEVGIYPRRYRSCRRALSRTRRHRVGDPHR
ncbi:hypothetical protein ABH900_000173 [Stenotrophomonas sp. AN71]